MNRSVHHCLPTNALRFLILFIIACSTTAEVDAMSFFSKRIVFSEVRGVVVHKGKPVEGAEIKRSFHMAMGNEIGTDHARCDAAGRFAFNRITRFPGLLTLLPHEPVIRQTIVISVGGEEYIAWQFVKHDYDDNGELDGKPLDLICDLGNEPTKRGGVYGICRIN